MRTFAKAGFRAFVVGLSFLVVGCGGLEPEDFAGAEARFEPNQFFAGRTRSWGVIEDRSGNPTSRFQTTALGHREGRYLVITQRFRFEDGRTRKRIWRLHRLDDHRYEATANDVVGVAVGEAFGNAFRWEYTLALDPGNPLKNVRLRHWMYLVDDGDTMINRVTISKLGVIIGEVTEYFRRDAGSVPTVTQGAAGKR